MNTDGAASASVEAQFNNQNGTQAASVPATLASYASTLVKSATAGLPDAWKGSTIVSSDKELASVANIHWKGTQAPDGVEAAAYLGAPAGDITAYLPFAVYAANSQYTEFAVQNTGTGTANITMTYFNRSGNDDYTITDTIPAAGQKLYDLHTPGTKIPVWSGTWVGSVVIDTGSATEKIAVVATNHWAGNSKPLYSVAYSGSTTGASKIFIPSVERRTGTTWETWLGFSVIIAQNIGGSSVDLTYHFFNKTTGLEDATFGPITVAAGAAAGCNTRVGAECATQAQMAAELTDPWVGSVVIDVTGGDVSAIAYSIRPRDNEAGSTTGASSVNGSTDVFLPDIYSIGASSATRTQWSLLRIQNVDASNDATVTMKFYDRAGALKDTESSITVPAGKSVNYNLKTDDWVPKLGANFSGGVYIDSSHPLAVVVENLWGLREMVAWEGYGK